MKPFQKIRETAAGVLQFLRHDLQQLNLILGRYSPAIGLAVIFSLIGWSIGLVAKLEYQRYQLENTVKVNRQLSEDKLNLTSENKYFLSLADKYYLRTREQEDHIQAVRQAYSDAQQEQAYRIRSLEAYGLALEQMVDCLRNRNREIETIATDQSDDVSGQ